MKRIQPFLLDNLDIAQWLIDSGCNIHSLDAYGVSPVRVAAIERNIDAIKLLVKGKNQNRLLPHILRKTEVFITTSHSRLVRCCGRKYESCSSTES